MLAKLICFPLGFYACFVHKEINGGGGAGGI